MGTKKVVMGQKGKVYFAETADGKYIKIGCSIEPEKRISWIHLGSPGCQRVRFLGWFPGGFETESWLHAKFKAQLIAGEWFKESKDIRSLIAVLGLTGASPLLHGHRRPLRRPKVRCQWCKRELTAAEKFRHNVMCDARPRIPEDAKSQKLVFMDRLAVCSKGGIALFAKMSPEQRHERAKIAAQKRWSRYRLARERPTGTQ